MFSEGHIFGATVLGDRCQRVNYIRKICPTCGEEFFVLNSAGEKAVYCNFKCLLKSSSKMDEISSMEPLDAIKPF
jgi:hypothetical protein